MPHTSRGKTRSRLNSFRHGLCATDDLFLSCLTRYERRVFQKFRSALHRDVTPCTFEEQLLVDRIAVQHLRQFRLYRLEYKSGTMALKYVMAPDTLIPNMDRFSRYDWRINRQIETLQKELKTLIRRRSKKSSKPLPTIN